MAPRRLPPTPHRDRVHNPRVPCNSRKGERQGRDFLRTRTLNINIVVLASERAPQRSIYYHVTSQGLLIDVTFADPEAALHLRSRRNPIDGSADTPAKGRERGKLGWRRIREVFEENDWYRRIHVENYVELLIITTVAKISRLFFSCAHQNLQFEENNVFIYYAPFPAKSSRVTLSQTGYPFPLSKQKQRFRQHDLR